MHNELLELSKQLHQIRKQKSQIQVLEKRKAKRLIELNTLKDKLEKEHKDYENLTKTTLQSIFYSIVTDINKKIDKEYKEYIEAKLKYESQLDQIKLINEELETLKSLSTNETEINNKYQSLLKSTEQELLQSNSPEKEDLLLLNSKLISIKLEYKESKEAYNYGNKLALNIDKLIVHLNSASRWGNFDRFGGGMISTLQKHSYLDEAKDLFKIIEFQLDNYNHEISETSINSVISTNINLSSFSKFADLFFDNFLVDSLIQTKIQQALKQSRQLNQAIRLSQNKLHNHLESQAKMAIDLQEQRNQIITKAF